MDDDAKRVAWIETLLARRAHPTVMNEVVLQLENAFISEGSRYFAEGKYDLALGKYFWALRLPEPANHKHDLLQLATDAYRLLYEQGTEADNIEVLNLPVFEDLKTQLKERWSRVLEKELYGRFRRLDGEKSLLTKKFDELEQLLAQLAPSAEGMLVSELRLRRERRAQELLKTIRRKLNKGAKQSHQAATAELFAEVKKLQQDALDFLDGSASNYTNEILEYVAAAEDLLVRSSVDRLASDITRESARLREEWFAEFVQSIRGSEASPEPDLLERGLRGICRAVRLFKGDGRLSEIKRLSLQWLEEYARFQYRRLATEVPEQARDYVAKAIGIIDGCSCELPLELADGFRAFLEEIQGMLDSAATPEQETVGGTVKPTFFWRFVKWIKRTPVGG
jgi:hypothetical protein